jgi:hypothetical protein
MILSEGINKVRAFAIPGGVCQNGKSNDLQGFVLVKWDSPYKDKRHQVYVNGKFSGVTTENSQRVIVAPLPVSTETAVLIEVFAVESQNANTDFSEAFTNKQTQGRVKIEFSKTMDGNVDFYIGDEKQNKESVKIQSGKNGFGWGGFGNHDFGFDYSSLPGFGKGNFGQGRFGLDAELLEWQSKQLESGIYKFKIKMTDEKGNEPEDAIETEVKTIIKPAKPAEKIIVDFFDKQNNKLFLKII